VYNNKDKLKGVIKRETGWSGIFCISCVVVIALNSIWGNSLEKYKVYSFIEAVLPIVGGYYFIVSMFGLYCIINEKKKR
jgi:hypothetical protein